MKINGVNTMMPQPGQAGMNQAMDSVSKNLQQQIERAQKQLQELSSNQEMSIEEKMKKRQELQKQISDLNQQLRQHQIELRRQKQQEKTASSRESSDSQSAQGNGSEQQGRGMSQEDMRALVSADNAIDQSRVQGSVAKQMEGRAGVLKAEIKLDAARGGDTQKKEEELADAEQIAAKATASQIDTLEEANRTLEETSKVENSTKQQDEAEQAAKSGTKQQDETEQAAKISAAETTGKREQEENKKIDVRL